MASITINIPDEQLQKLQQLARDSQVSPEDLLRVNIEEWLARPQDEFIQAADYVLKKNAELYRQLA
jgi:antitoxin FitA